MTTPALWLLASAGLAAVGVLAGSEDPASRRCHQDRLVSWNCAEHFSGSLSWKSQLKSQTQVGIQIDHLDSVTVTIAAGVASCKGIRLNRESEKGDYEAVTTGTFSGPGLVAVEFGRGTDDSPNQPFYQITVACGGPSGQTVSRSLRSGEKTTTALEQTPLRIDDGMSTYKRPGSQADRELSGSLEDEHPEADAANGLGGKLSLKWRLTRISPVTP